MITPRITIKLSGNPHLGRQTTFALASTLTKVGKEAQKNVVKSLRGTFQIRNNWVEQSNVFGVRVKSATKDNLEVTIGTAADWLSKFLQKPAGSIAIRTPRGNFIAVPTSNVRRTKRDIIRAMQRPRALKGKRDVVLPLRNHPGAFGLFQRRGHGHSSHLDLLYVLAPEVKIKEVDILEGPVLETFEKRFAPVFDEQLKQAFATAR